jgi:hypothetical protein
MTRPSGKIKMRMALIEQSIVEYLEQLNRIDRRETPSSPRETATYSDLDDAASSARPFCNMNLIE